MLMVKCVGCLCHALNVHNAHWIRHVLVYTGHQWTACSLIACFQLFVDVCVKELFYEVDVLVAPRVILDGLQV